MSWESYSWLLLRACGVNQNQLLNLLLPFHGRFPRTEAEFQAVPLSVRRMGHIMEGAPSNITPPSSTAPSLRGYGWEC